MHIDSSYPQVSTGQGGQEAVAGLLQSLVGQKRQQHQHIANKGQQDQQTKDAACRKADVTSTVKSCSKTNVTLRRAYSKTSVITVSVKNRLGTEKQM